MSQEADAALDPASSPADPDPCWAVDESAAQAPTGHGPHFECDCVPDLGPSHCHRCSRSSGIPTPWAQSPCQSVVEGEGFPRLVEFFEARGETRFAALTIASIALDALTAVPSLQDPGKHAAASDFGPLNRSAEPEAGVEAEVEAETPTAPVPVTEPVAVREDEPVPVEPGPEPEAPEPEVEPAAAPIPEPPAAREPTAPVVAVQTAPVPDPGPAAEPSVQPMTEAMAEWRMSKLAKGQARKLGMTRNEVVALAFAPTADLRASAKNGTNHWVDGLLILTDLQEKTVISIIEDPMPACGPKVPFPEYVRRAHRRAGFAEVLVVDPRSRPGSQAGAGAPVVIDPFANRRSIGNPRSNPATKLRSASGGRGRRSLDTPKELVAAMVAHGFQVDLRKAGHYVATLQAKPGWKYTLGSTPSDHKAYIATITDIRRQTGIDISLP